MPEKLPTTPNGIVCKVCGQDKPAYHYFKHSGTYNQDFFTTELGYTSGVCFDCAGPYKCISCGQIKDASEFRTQGRICKTCKNAPVRPGAPVADAISDDLGVSGFDSIEAPENGGYD